MVAAYRALPGAHLSNGYAEQLADVGRRAAEAEVLVAADDGLLGCVTFVSDATSPWAELLEDNEASIRMLAVDPTVQGRGVGRALLDACLDRARPARSDAIFLHSTPWMQAAHHLYAGAGFVRVPTGLGTGPGGAAAGVPLRPTRAADLSVQGGADGQLERLSRPGEGVQVGVEARPAGTHGVDATWVAPASRQRSACLTSSSGHPAPARCVPPCRWCPDPDLPPGLRQQSAPGPRRARALVVPGGTTRRRASRCVGRRPAIVPPSQIGRGRRAAAAPGRPRSPGRSGRRRSPNARSTAVAAGRSAPPGAGPGS